MAKRKTIKKKHKPNSKYWRNKADKAFMPQFVGKPCAICGTTYLTCGHHVVEKSLSSYYRHAPRNIVVLCTTHHKYGNDIAPHSKNPLAVKAWLDWLPENRKDAWKILNTYKKKTGAKVDYEKIYKKLEELK